MEQENLNTLYVAELRDLLNSENQLIKAIPKMAQNANSKDLRSGFERHLEQTRDHAKRIEQVLQARGEKVRAKKCKGMQGIIAEGNEIMKQDYDGPLLDSALISAAQRVEHYEIAAYGCVREYARLLGENEAVSLLSKTLEEEKETDQKLTELAHQINQDAAQGTQGSGSDNEESVGVQGAKTKTAGA